MYWSLLGYFAVGALVAPRNSDAPRLSLFYWLGLVVLTLAIGLRYQVGGDWQAYLRLFDYLRYLDLDRAMDFGDPGYQFVAWIIQRAGGQMWLLNVLCAAIFVWGLNRFARTQPSPWLTLVVAVPYLIVVVAMGYTRQATAIGILMAGLAAIISGAGILRFLPYLVAAALFHKSAVFMLPLVVFALQTNRFVNIVVGIVSGFFLYGYFLADSWDDLVENYIRAEYASQGATIRLFMSLLPSVIFLAVRSRLGMSAREERLWWVFAVTSLAMLGLLVVLPSSTAVDRLALYLIPIQLAVVPRLASFIHPRALGILAVIAYAAVVQFTWLNYAAHARYWVPYSFWPF